MINETEQSKKKSLPKPLVLRIYMMYYGMPCKFKKKGTAIWKRSLINELTINNFDTHDCVLLLKPLYKLSARNVEMIHKLMSQDDEFKDEDLDLSENGIKEFREHLQDTLTTMPYIVADYLRKEAFHLPLFGIDLYKANLAHVFNGSQF